MNRIFFLIISVVLVSCGVNKISVKPENSTTFTPELNKTNNSEIGTALVYKEIGYTYHAIQVTKQFNIRLSDVTKTIEADEVFINNHNTNNYYLYSNPNDLSIGIAIPKDSKTAILYTTSYIDGIYNSGFTHAGMNFITPKEKIEYIETLSPAKEKNYYKQEFIYNGRIGNNLKFIYREYVNDYARPAFSQDLQYDLSESNIIGFKGLRIEILEVTNTQIEYKVLSYFLK